MKVPYNRHNIFKKIISSFLAIIIVFSSMAGFAADGDIIHIGRQQLFSVNSPTQSDDIIKAIENGADPNGFYRVIENDDERKYVNIAKTQEDQEKYLIEELIKAGVDLTNSDSITSYVANNPSLGTKLESIETKNTYEFKSIPNIGNQAEAIYFGGDLKPSLVVGVNYSTPEPGSQDNTTKIKDLKLPVGSYQWKIKLSETEEKSIPFNKELKETEGYKKYSKDTNIEVKTEKYLGLYAVTTESKVKAFASIELKPEMLKKPREISENLGTTDLKDVKVEKLDNIGNAVKIIGIPTVEPEATHEFKVILKDSKIEKVYVDMKIEEKDFISNINNIKVADEQLLEDFTKYLYVLKLSKGKETKILGYKEIEINKGSINSPAPKLATTSYTGPVKGNADGSTKFTKLEGDFKYIIADKVDLPLLDADYSTIGTKIAANTDIKPTTEQKTLIGKELLLVAVDTESKVKAYAKFNLTTENVKGQTAPELTVKVEDLTEYNYTLPTKGTAEGTTKIAELKLDNVDNSTKFMYQILDEEPESPMINETRTEAKDLQQNQDIQVSLDKYLLILATDNEGKIKAYAVEKITQTMIKDSLDNQLQLDTHYAEPERGTKDGTTRFDHLKYSNAKLYYKLSSIEIETPQKDTVIEGEEYEEIIFKEGTTKTENIEIFKSTDEKLKDENGFAFNMMVYAVNEKKEVLAYKNFIINQDNVKLPDADLLPATNYGKLRPGTTENSTILDELNKRDITNADKLNYYYKFILVDTKIGINEKVKGINKLEIEKDLRTAKAGEVLLILLADSEYRTKYYATIPLTTENVRGANAGNLITPTHYSEPVPGSINGSTKFVHLGFGTGDKFIKDATKFMVKISDKPFGKIEINKPVQGSFEYAKIVDGKKAYIKTDEKSDETGNILKVDSKTNRYLLLLATDSHGNVKSYKEFLLDKKNIRGENAMPIPEDNYALGIGEKPSTTRFTKLKKYEFDENITWLYKWSEDGKFSPEKPYINQIVDTNEFKSIRENQDMTVSKIEGKTEEPKYGYILLYAVLNSREVQGYKAIPVNSNSVKEHADKLTNVKLEIGTKTDHTKVSITGIETYNYIITKSEPDVPAKNEAMGIVAKDATTIINGQELLVTIGQYITVYKVDENNKVQGYISLPITAENIKQGTAKFEVLNEKEEIEIPEGNLNNGLYEIKITLTDAEWSENLYSIESVRNSLFDSFTVDKEKENWDKVVSRLKGTGRHGLRIDGKTLTITTTRTDDYDIADEQRITLTIPAIALKNANNPIKVTGTIVVKPTVGATISGSIMTNNRQKDINSGEATIIVKLKDGSFIWNDTNKEALINGFVGSLGDTGIWKKVREDIITANVDPQGPQEVKITIPANTVTFGTQTETITLTIPWNIIRDAKENENIVATPRFEIRPDILRVEGEINKDESKVEVEAPLYKEILSTANKWIIDIKVGTVRHDLTIRDIEISGLSGLKPTFKKVEGKNQIEITLSGISTTPIPEEGKELEITIKGSAIEETNSLDSRPIRGKISREGSIINELKAVTINVATNTLVGFNKETMQYSLNSKTGTDGDDWSNDITQISTNGGFKPGRVYVRSIDNKKVFHLVADLKSASAPTGINIGEINYTAKTISIDGLDKNKSYEYSIDGGVNWSKLDKPILLTEGISDIRVRLASTEKELYSLPTLALKFIDLSKVEMNVATKEITNTLLGMQYKFEENGTVKSAIGGTIKNVVFEPGELIVFQNTNPKNSRVVGTVKMVSPGEQPNKNHLTFDISEGEVTGTDLEFTITTLTPDKYNTIKDTEWQSTGENIQFKAGTLVFRKKATKDTLPSEIVAKEEIIAPAEEAPIAPKLEIDNYNKEIKYDGKSLGEAECLLEYRIAPSKDWLPSIDWANDKEKIKDQDITVYVRVKAEKHKLPSKEVSISLTANINLDGVTLNLAEGLLENTTSRMEYSFNSTDGIDGDWELASNGKTNIIAIDKLHELEEKTIYIRQNKNEKQNRVITSSIKRNTLAVKDSIEINYKGKTITNTATEAIEVKLGNGSWITIVNGKPLIDVNFVSGQDIIYRTKATKDKIYSDSALKEMVPYPGPTPYVKPNDNTNKVEIVGVDENTTGITSGYEFKEKTSENWLDVEIGNLAEKVFNGDTKVQIRKSATSKEVASSIKEITFTKNLDWTKVGFDKYGNPPQILNTEPEMEYQIFFKNQEPPKDWKKAIKGNTLLNEIKNIEDVVLVLIRDGRTKIDEKRVYGEEKDRPVDLEKVGYKIETTRISFTEITDKMEYKKLTDSSWTIGSDTAGLTNLSLEPVELTIRDKNYPTKTRTIKVDTRATTPNIQVEKFHYKEDGTIDMTLSGFDKDKMEYSIDGGVVYKDFTDTNSIFTISKNDKLFIIAKAVPGENKAGKLPSLPTAQLNGIYLGEVGLNPMERKIEGTSELMEYSLNSTDGKNGSWSKTRSPDTTTPNFTTGMTVWIREIDKPLNAKELSPKIERESAPIKTDISYDILGGTIKNTTERNLKYRISGGTWIDLPIGKTASSVEFKAGDFHILAKGGVSTLDSDPVLVTTIKSEGSKPTVEYDDVNNKVTKINGITDFSTFEYKLSNSNYWIDGSFLKGEEFVGEVIVQIRIKAISTELPSQVAEIKFTALDLRKVRLSTYVEPYELNGTTGDMEFRLTISGVELEGDGWIRCVPDLKGNIQLYYIIKGTSDKVYITKDNFNTVDKIHIRNSIKKNEFVEVPKNTP